MLNNLCPAKEQEQFTAAATRPAPVPSAGEPLTASSRPSAQEARRPPAPPARAARASAGSHRGRAGRTCTEPAAGAGTRRGESGGSGSGGTGQRGTSRPTPFPSPRPPAPAGGTCHLPRGRDARQLPSPSGPAGPVRPPGSGTAPGGAGGGDGAGASERPTRASRGSARRPASQSQSPAADCPFLPLPIGETQRTSGHRVVAGRPRASRGRHLVLGRPRLLRAPVRGARRPARGRGGCGDRGSAGEAHGEG